MKKIIAASMVMSMAVTGAVNAQPVKGEMPPAPPGYEEKMKHGSRPEIAEKIKERANKRFDEMDINNDGTVSKEEHADFAVKRANERFVKMDKNNDGKVTKEEFEANRPSFNKAKPVHRSNKPMDARVPVARRR